MSASAWVKTLRANYARSVPRADGLQLSMTDRHPVASVRNDGSKSTTMGNGHHRVCATTIVLEIALKPASCVNCSAQFDRSAELKARRRQKSPKSGWDEHDSRCFGSGIGPMATLIGRGCRCARGSQNAYRDRASQWRPCWLPNHDAMHFLQTHGTLEEARRAV